jgi:TonB family protein
MTKNLSSLLLGALLLFFAGIACKNPIASYTKQYSCTIAGLPEPANSNEYVDRGYKHYEDNDYKNDPGNCALGACAEAIRLDPQNADAYYCRAMMLRDKGERDKALADINEAIRLRSDKAQYYWMRGTLYGEKDMYEKGLEDLNRQIELDGDAAKHYDYNRRGDFYYELGKFEEALKDYTKAIELKPDYQYHYSDRASAYEKLGKTDLAEADKLKASELELAGKVEQPPTGSNTGNSNSNKSPNSWGNTISGGIMNDKATTLPEPVYPPAARAVRAAGAVNVQIAVDENGNVTSATAVSGHPLLRSAAVAAARGAKFKPTLINGKPYRVTGVLVFNFAP